MDLDADRAQSREDRVTLADGQYRDHVQAGQRQGSRHVDAFAARFHPHLPDPVHGPAHQRAGQRDGPIDTRIRCDGDDHGGPF